MASRKRFSYRWRLLVVMVGLSWLIIGVCMVYQHKREEDIRIEAVRDQLMRVSDRILASYEYDEDFLPLGDFFVKYFRNSVYKDMRVSVYDANDILLYSIGTPMEMNPAYTEEFSPEQISDQAGDGENKKNHRDFFVSLRKSNDGNVRVLVAVPSAVIASTLQTDGEFWGIVAILFVVVSVIAYYSTGILTRNVNTLTEFANRAIRVRNPENGEKVTFDDLKFPDDELGDVSRKLVQLYTEKVDALDKSEREHKIAIHAVEEKSRIKRQLTNNINHELKTPIGVIRGYIDTILSSDDMDEATRTHFLLRAQKNVDRLCSLLNDVSTMTRLEEGSGNIPVTDVNMHDLVYTIANDLAVSNLVGNLEFKYDVPLDCVVKGNASLLLGMISNLIKNAGLHSHGTEVVFKTVSETDKYYSFVLYDNGTGVADEHLPHLFERFYRIDAGRSRRVGGTGLGLPIVKNTVEALGGTINVRNRASGGLEFVFTLEKWKARC